jgi:hypothetical protein
MQMAEYQKTLLVYLDIMGFKKMIEESQNDSTKVDVIIDMLKKVKAQTDISFKRPITSRVSVDAMEPRNFSDLVLRITALGEGPIQFRTAIMNECAILAAIQSELFLSSGILLRGGMCIDDLYHENEIVFGPALVKTYELETNVAVFPRIVVDAKSCLLHGTDENTSPQFYLYVRRGDDGAYFIDYLYHSYINMFVMSQYKSDEKRFLSQHKMQVESKLEEYATKDYRIKQKGLWLALYHNSVIKRLAEEYPDKKDLFPDLLISDSLLRI